MNLCGSVFHRKELKPLTYLYELRGKRLAIGMQGSGTRVLVMQLLRDNGIDSVNTQLLELSHTETEIKLQSGEIDAAFFVMSQKSKTIPNLASHPEISIMDFSKREKAYTSYYPFLTSLVIGEGMMAEFYQLRTHTNLVLRQLEDRRDLLIKRKLRENTKKQIT